MGPTRTLKSKSKVWKFFDKGPKCQCKICGKEIASCGNTTNLKNHLVRFHKKEFDGDDSNTSIPSSRTGVPPVTHVPSCGDPDEEDIIELGESQTRQGDQGNICGRGSTSSRPSSSTCSWTSTSEHCNSPSPTVPSQPAIDNVFRTIVSYSNGGHREIQLTEDIVEMILGENLPLSLVESSGFTKFMKKLVPRYTLPSRRKLTKLIDVKYEKSSGIVKNELSVLQNVCLTTDVWTNSMTMTSFLGLTVHYIKNSRFHSICIGVEPLSSRHTAPYLKDILQSLCRDWKIPVTALRAVVTDNASNITSAVSLLFGSKCHLPCFAHTINLVCLRATESADDVSTLIKKIKCIVTFFKHSVVASDQLKHLQEMAGRHEGTILKLIQDVPTRWNSTYYMIERFLNLASLVSSVLLAMPKSPLMISGAEIECLNEIIALLGPFEQVTKEMSGEKYTTASSIIPTISCLTWKLEKIELSQPAAIALKMKLKDELVKRFEQVEYKTNLAIATVLDPRYKRLHFQHPKAASDAFSQITVEMGTPLLSQAKEDANISSADSADDGLWSYHSRLAAKHAEEEAHRGATANTLPTELQHYLQQKVCNRDKDPVAVWEQELKYVYPNLAEIAIKYLSILGTSVPSERLFSKAGATATQLRNRLTGKRLSKLLFLNSYIHNND